MSLSAGAQSIQTIFLLIWFWKQQIYLLILTFPCQAKQILSLGRISLAVSWGPQWESMWSTRTRIRVPSSRGPDGMNSGTGTPTLSGRWETMPLKPISQVLRIPGVCSFASPGSKSSSALMVNWPAGAGRMLWSNWLSCRWCLRWRWSLWTRWAVPKVLVDSVLWGVIEV